MLSLGSTGFTTVEETGSSDSNDCEQLCTGIAIDVFDGAIDRGETRDRASFFADLAYASCMSRCDRPSLEPIGN